MATPTTGSTLAGVNQATADAYEAAEQRAEEAAEAAQAARRPAWLTEIHASARAWAHERVAAYMTAEQRVADIEEGGDWAELESAQAAVEALGAELFGRASREVLRADQ